MDKQWDALVIGAGLGGLASAATLAKAGLRVLVLDQNTGPGGYAHGMQRGEFYFDFSLHSMDGVAPGGWAYYTLNKLGVLDRLEFTRLDPYYVAHYPKHKITAYANPIAYEQELMRHFPDEVRGIRSLLDEMMAIYTECHRLRADHAFEIQLSPEEILARYPRLIQGVRESWGQLLARHIRNPELKAIINTQWAYCGLPPSRLNAATFALLWGSAFHYGAFYPRGGSMAINRALESLIQENGGELRYGQRVTQIHIQDGLVVGVSTAQGLEAQARIYVSNANAPQTMLKLIAPEHLPAGYASRMEVTPDSLSSFNIYMGLDRDLVAEGWPSGFALTNNDDQDEWLGWMANPHNRPHEMFVADNYDPEAQYAAIVGGDWEHVPFMLVHYTGTRPDCAPPGKSALTLMSLTPWNYRDQWGTRGDLSNYEENAQYQQIKESVAETLLKRAEEHVPGLHSSICFKEIATPITNVKYTLNRGGAILGFEQSVEGMYQGRLGEATPFPNLWLVGAWTQPGGGQSAAMLSGVDGAGNALKYLQQQPAVSKPRPAPTRHPAAVDTLPLGQPAPDFKLEAVGSGREVSLQSCAKRPLVLIFATQNTTATIGEVNGAVRSQWPLATQVTVASVIALGGVPGLFHGLINFALKRTYQQSAKEMPDGFGPADYVIILPDWSGQVCQAFKVQGADKAAVVVLVDRAGKVQGVFQGEHLAEATTSLLQWM